MRIECKKRSTTDLLSIACNFFKIAVVGSGGAGKSSIAECLSSSLCYEKIELDSIFWEKNWAPIDSKRFQEIINLYLERDNVIIVGTYENYLSSRINKCDLFIFIDLPVFKCLFRVILRSIKNFGKPRFGMAEGCVENFFSLDYLKFLLWILKYRKIQSHLISLCEKKNIDYVIFKR